MLTLLLLVLVPILFSLLPLFMLFASTVWLSRLISVVLSAQLKITVAQTMKVAYDQGDLVWEYVGQLNFP